MSWALITGPNVLAARHLLKFIENRKAHITHSVQFVTPLCVFDFKLSFDARRAYGR